MGPASKRRSTETFRRQWSWRKQSALALHAAPCNLPRCWNQHAELGTSFLPVLISSKASALRLALRSILRTFGKRRNRCINGGTTHKTRLIQADFFATDWKRLISELPEPILVLGNPPWVTNSQLGVLGSRNLPIKSNFQKHDGLDALTGKANFDISEWMLMRLVEALNGRRGTLAMLCKAATAQDPLLRLAEWNGRGTIGHLWHRC